MRTFKSEDVGDKRKSGGKQQQQQQQQDIPHKAADVQQDLVRRLFLSIFAAADPQKEQTVPADELVLLQGLTKELEKATSCLAAMGFTDYELQPPAGSNMTTATPTKQKQLEDKRDGLEALCHFDLDSDNSDSEEEADATTIGQQQSDGEQDQDYAMEVVPCKIM